MIHDFLFRNASPALMAPLVGLSVLLFGCFFFMILAARFAPQALEGSLPAREGDPIREPWVRKLLHFVEYSSTLMGLLGTILGMSFGFGYLGKDPGGGAASMGLYIATALHTTAVGIILHLLAHHVESLFPWRYR